MKTLILFKINEVTDALENMLYWLSSAWLKPWLRPSYSSIQFKRLLLAQFHIQTQLNGAIIERMCAKKVQLNSALQQLA